MAELKTRQNKASVARFLRGIKDERSRKDCRTLVTIMKGITKQPPRMWGTSIVGFGTFHYRYATGREGDWFLVGFSPRKQNLTIYVMTGFRRYDSLMKRLGKYKTGKSCLYVNNLEEIDLVTFKKLVKQSVQRLKKKK